MKFTDLREYGSELAVQLSDAWKLTRDQVKCAQKWQNMHNDQKARPSQLLTGGRAFLYRPAAEKIEEG